MECFLVGEQALMLGCSGAGKDMGWFWMMEVTAYCRLVTLECSWLVVVARSVAAGSAPDDTNPGTPDCCFLGGRGHRRYQSFYCERHAGLPSEDLSDAGVRSGQPPQ